MPIARWLCPSCNREVPLNHFATTACGERIHPDYAAAILKDRSEQYVTDAVRVSHGLGCPRRAAIEASEDYAVSPLDANASLTGVAWHALVEASAPPELAEVEVSGTIVGIKVRGKIDRLRMLVDGTWAIEDWKHGSDFQTKWRKQDGAKPEHVLQTSLYAELCEQSGRPRPIVGIIWYHNSGSAADALMPFRFDLLPLYEVLAARPYDCEFTVLELLQQADAHFSRAQHWQEMPLAGKSIKFGTKTGCDYCSVKSVCWTEANGAPF